MLLICGFNLSLILFFRLCRRHLQPLEILLAPSFILITVISYHSCPQEQERDGI